MSQVSDHRKLRYEDYARIPDDGLRHEVIDGEHFMTPSPTSYHQLVLQRINIQLFNQIMSTGLGTVFVAPIDVELSEHDIVQPDLVVVLTGNRIITPTKIKGSPDLLIEILSPSTRDNDRNRKRQSYEAAGVPEYWIADPDEHEVAQLVLTDGKYVAREHDGKLGLSIVDNVTVDFSEVW